MPGALSPATGFPEAEAEIGSLPPPPRRAVSGAEANAALRRIAERLEGPARSVCMEIGAATCAWWVEGSPNREMNALAAGNGRIVVFRGILEAARNEEEVAFVLGHEMAHQAAAHVAAGRRAAEIGGAIGAIALGALGIAAAAAGGSPTAAGRLAESGAAIGGRIGRLAFSKEQEREADELGGVILHRAGYDLDLARGFLVTMARASARRETGLLDTHPAGPERLAAFDAALPRIRAGAPLDRRGRGGQAEG